MKIVTFEQIKNIIKNQHPGVRNIWCFDSQYTAPNMEEFKEIIEEIKPITIKFKQELFDCDDYALVMAAFVKLKAAVKFHKGIAFGEITVRNTMLAGEVHSLNVLITEDKKMHYYEPQGKTFVDGQNYKPFFVRI